MPTFYDEPRETTLYDFDDDGVYLGTRTKIIPAGVGLPRNATETPPLRTLTNEAAVFDKDAEAWSVVPDERGVVFYDADGLEVEIKKVGPRPPGLSRTRPPRSVPLRVQDVREAVRRHIDRIAKAEGFDSMLDAVSYADEVTDTTRQPVGLALRQWRSQVLNILQLALDQPGPPPDANDVLDLLPDFTG